MSQTTQAIRLGQRTSNQVTSQYSQTRMEAYTYDEVNRLKTVNYGDENTQGYTFDALGNWLTKTDNWTGNDAYTHNAANIYSQRSKHILTTQQTCRSRATGRLTRTM